MDRSEDSHRQRTCGPGIPGGRTDFAERNTGVVKYLVPQRSTMMPGWKAGYTVGENGWFTSEGKILTFWYK